MSATDPHAPRWKGFPVLYVAVCLVGATVSVISTLDHIEFRQTGGDAAGFCAAIVDRGCGAAHEASASEILGLPISLFGLAFYAGLALAAALGRVRRPRLAGIPLPGPATPVALVGAGIGSIGYSVYLASVLIRLGEICPFCATLYGVNAALLVLAVAWAWPQLRRPGRAVRDAIRPGVFALAAGLVALAIAVPTYRAAVAAAPVKPAPAPEAKPLAPEQARALLLPDRVPSRGNPAAPVTLIEFSDLECPWCERMHETLSALYARLGPERLRVRFVHFPLDTACNCHVSVCLHQTACLAARAATCAAAEGEFWEYSDRLYAHRKDHQRADLLRMASDVGLDPARMDACIDDPKTAAAVAEDVEIAHAVGVTATPTILLNGLKVEGAVDLSRLLEIVERSSICSCDLASEVCGVHAGTTVEAHPGGEGACGADMEQIGAPPSCE